MGSTPVTGSNLKALRDAPLSFLDFLYKSALRYMTISISPAHLFGWNSGLP
jgi:hypothetical protein